MTYEEIIIRLRAISTRSNFDTWVSANIDPLSVWFYSVTGPALLELKFDTEFYFKEFAQSAVFKHFELNRQHTKPLDAFLYLLAVAAEKMAECGLIAPMEHLLTYLPESSVKYRLRALSMIQSVDNIKSDYYDLFPTVLELLARAENYEEEHRTQKLVDFLIYYFLRAQGKLKEKGYTAELDRVKAIFANSDWTSRYHFLRHVSIQDIVSGVQAWQLKLEKTEVAILYPSDIMTNHFKYSVNAAVFEDKRTVGFDRPLGYEKIAILNDVLKRGKAAFDSPHGLLSPDDKVVLYCYFNMKKHFFTSKNGFFKNMALIDRFFLKGSTYSHFYRPGLRATNFRTSAG